MTADTLLVDGNFPKDSGNVKDMRLVRKDGVVYRHQLLRKDR